MLRQLRAHRQRRQRGDEWLQTAAGAMAHCLLLLLCEGLCCDQNTSRICGGRGEGEGEERESWGRKQQNTNRKPQTTNRKLQTTNRKPQTANCKPQTANCKPQTANRKPQTANRKPQTANEGQHLLIRDELWVEVDFSGLRVVAHAVVAAGGVEGGVGVRRELTLGFVSCRRSSPRECCRVRGLGVEVWGLGFGVWGLGFGVYEYRITPFIAPRLQVEGGGGGRERRVSDNTLARNWAFRACCRGPKIRRGRRWRCGSTCSNRRY